MNAGTPVKLILASTSKYRKQQVDKFGIHVEQFAPTVDEESLKNQLLAKNRTPLQIANDLAFAKGQSVVDQVPALHGCTVLSGDQLVSFENKICGKPHTAEKAVAQLKMFRGQWHELITSVVLWTTRGPKPHTEIIKLKMHDLSDREIQGYVQKDNPVDCAGSYKFELNGAALFEQVMSSSNSDLKNLAKDALKFAYSPYSKVKIGAAVKLSNGQVYSGCNIENASYGGTVCAERVAIFKAYSENPSTFKITEVAVASEAAEPWPPCGFCRQVIAEFAAPDTVITLVSTNGTEKKMKFSELFPSAFGPENFK